MTRRDYRVRFGPARIEQRAFGVGRPYPAEHQTYFSDLLASYGKTARASGFAAGRNSYLDMTTALAPQIRQATDRFDIAVLAHATPDAEPSWPMCYLADSVAEAGLAFAVSDQGVAAPFTALRLILDSARAGGTRRALMLVMEQVSLLHDDPVPATIRPARDRAIVLMLDDQAGIELASVRQHTQIGPEDAQAVLTSALRAAADDGRPVSAIFGLGLLNLAGLADLAGESGLAGGAADAAVRVRWAPAGQPCTGIWSLLADEVAIGRGTPRRIMLADYDQRLGYLCQCVLEEADG